MAIYKVDDIIKEVRICFDENETSTPLIDECNEPTLSLNAIIKNNIRSAARSVIEYSPTRLLDDGIDFISAIRWKNSTAPGIGMGSISLPPDFMRLVIFKMSEWNRPVTNVIYDTDPTYYLQHSKFSGISGGVDKPVCAITTDKTGKRFEFFSCKAGSSSHIDVAQYIPYPDFKNISNIECIDVCKNLYIPFIYYCTALSFSIYENQEKSNLLFSIAKDYLK
ncbi:MAG: hypothetical protein RR280_07470 [Bacteroidaceae bacterium]